MNIVTERFKKRSLVNRQVLEEQLQAYREDGKHSARNLEEVRRLISESKYNEAFELLNKIANMATSESNDDESEQDGSQYINKTPIGQSPVRDSQTGLVYEKTIIDLIIDKYKVKCHSRGIQFNYRVESKALNNIMSAKEVTSVIENLMDNAIEAIVRQMSVGPRDERWIELQITYSQSSHKKNEIMIQVQNSGKTLTEDHANKIFTAGVTSKTGDNHGYGLAVVMDIVKSLGGTIKASTNPETSIQVLVPKI